MTCNITLATKASFYSLAMLSHLIGLWFVLNLIIGEPLSMRQLPPAGYW